MKMFPAYLYENNSNAEKKVFKKLQDVNSLGENSVAFHSLNIPEHISQRSGEADFVLLCEKGLFVFEIKGGRIWRNEKGWTYTNRQGKNFLNRRGPFRQAEEAMYSIVKRLEEHLGHQLTRNLISGYGVIIPDCNLPDSEEWNREILLNSNTFDLFDQWLGKFINYWEEKSFRGKPLKEAEIEKISEFLRPTFETTVSLHSKIENAEESICKFTNDQFNFLDIMAENSRIICSGGAGTGKTFLAAELSRRFSPNNNVLLVCRSKILASYLKTQLQDIQNTVVSTIEALPAEAKRNKLEKFDVLIIDEGQDLCNFEDLAKLEPYLNNGWEKGSWYFFHDINNQSGLVGKFDEEAMGYLKSFNPVFVPLKKNCRNTRQIMEKIQDLTSFDMGNSGYGQGPDVAIINTTENQQLEALCEELDKLHNEGIKYHEITLLSPLNFADSCVNQMQGTKKKRIQVINDYNVFSPDINKIQFSSIADFKGLENQCVILVDINANLNDDPSTLYVGMSRARAKLTVIRSEN